MGKVGSIPTSTPNDSAPALPTLESLKQLSNLAPAPPKQEVSVENFSIPTDIEKLIDTKLKAMEERLNQRIDDASEHLYRRIEALIIPKST